MNPVRVAIIDSGIDGRSPGVPQPHLARQELGRRQARHRRGGPRHLRRGNDRGGHRQQRGHRGHGLSGAAHHRQDRAPGPVHRRARRGRGDPLGGRRRRARDQLSLGGLRDPFNPRATRSRASRRARSTTRSAAAPCSSRPSGTPTTHRSRRGRSRAIRRRSRTCIGVSALSPTGNVPQFSNRDRIYNDISAPGQEIYSTLPRALTVAPPALPEPGLLRLRAGRVPPRGGHVVRRATGHGGGGRPVRAQPGVAARPGR